MKKAVYIVIATLVAVGLTIFLIQIIPNIDTGDNTSALYSQYLMIYNYGEIFTLAGIYLTLGILSLIQFAKSMPRLMALFGGAAVFGSLNTMLTEVWSLWFFIAAGILAIVWEVSRVPKPALRPQTVKQQYDGFLIAAGVLAMVNVAYLIFVIIASILSIIELGASDLPFIYFFNLFTNVLGIIQSVCIAVFSFNKALRASVLCRLFFIGQITLEALLIPLKIAGYSSMSSLAFISFINIPIIFALAVIVLAHTAFTRHNSLAPSQPVWLPPQTNYPPPGYYQPR